MGNLLTLTIRTDGIHEIMNHCEEFCEKVYGSINNYASSPFGLGSFCNLVDVQKLRHTDDHSIYVSMGGSLSEMRTDSEDTDRFLLEHPKCFKETLDYMKEQVQELDKKYTESLGGLDSPSK